MARAHDAGEVSIPGITAQLHERRDGIIAAIDHLSMYLLFSRVGILNFQEGVALADNNESQIGVAELSEYLDDVSDFAFELRCLERMNKLGFLCQHGGSYTDPLTKKNREFDIRAQKEHGAIGVKCAIECKQISETHPLLVMCVPRSCDESYHELILSVDPDPVDSGMGVMDPTKMLDFLDSSNAHAYRVGPPFTEYGTAQLVGKSCVQVFKKKDDSISGSDSDVYGKWAQALSSAADLIDSAAIEGKRHGRPFLSLVLPVLVVPDGLLWQVNYEASGEKVSEPRQVKRCSYFVGCACGYNNMGSMSATLSHIEFVTLSGLEELMNEVLFRNNSWFPIDEIQRQGLASQS